MTNKELIRLMQKELDRLKKDTLFGILTRPAVELEYKKLKRAGYIVFIDLDGIHELNSTLGYAEVNKRVRRALRVRHDDLLLSGRWASGDEIIFCLQDNPEGFCYRLLRSLSKWGLSGTIAYTRAGKSLIATVKKCSDRVQQAKRDNMRGYVYKV